MVFIFFFSSRRRHTRCALVTGVQTCALPISAPLPRRATAAVCFRRQDRLAIRPRHMQTRSGSCAGREVMAVVERIPSFGFVRGAIVRKVSGGPNMLVVRGLEDRTVVVVCEADDGCHLRLRDYPNAALAPVQIGRSSTRERVCAYV